MARPFDATLKDLIDAHPSDWARIGVGASGPVSVIDADLSTVTADADKILRLEEPSPWLLHLELQSGADASLDGRILRYNVLIRERHRLPVHSIVFLLRPQAEAPANRGELSYASPYPGCRLTFEYQIVKLWRMPVERVLDAGIGVLPIAPLCDQGDLPSAELIRRIDTRFGHTGADAARLWTSTYILMGLRYPPEAAAALLQGVARMKESSTYQAIINEGRQEGREEGMRQGSAGEARRILMMLGSQRLGPASPEVKARLDEETGVERLEELIQRLLTAHSWSDLLDG